MGANIVVASYDDNRAVEGMVRGDQNGDRGEGGSRKPEGNGEGST